MQFLVNYSVVYHNSNYKFRISNSMALDTFLPYFSLTYSNFNYLLCTILTINFYKLAVLKRKGNLYWEPNELND